MQLTFLKAAIGLLLTFGFTVSFAQPVVLVNESFTTTNSLFDLSTLQNWGSFTSPTSAFTVGTKADGGGLSFQAISSTDSAKKYVGYTRIDQLKASSAFDIRFPKVDRSNDTLTLEFDMLWNRLTAGGNESRVVIAFLHDIPARPIQFGDLDSTQLTNPFGRPAYSFRVLGRNPSGSNNYANMMYGGGRDTLGEFEKYSNSTAVPPLNYWLPGFISGPGGVTPEAPGLGYPLNGQGVRRWQISTLASSTAWQHFRWVLYPERLELYHRPTADPVANEILVLFMALPKPTNLSDMLNFINSYHTTSETQLPKLYNYFPELEGIRIYFNSGDITSMANLKVEATAGIPFVGGYKNLVKTMVVYPNPAKDLIYLPDLSGQMEYPVQLVSSLGKCSQILAINGQISVSDISPGLYRILVRKGDKFYTNSFIKE